MQVGCASLPPSIGQLSRRAATPHSWRRRRRWPPTFMPTRAALPHFATVQAPITFTAKHWTADVFEDGSCVHTKPVGRSAQQPEEKVLWTAGEHMRFANVEAFLAALKAGALNAMFGPEAAAQMAQQAAAATAAASAVRSRPMPATTAAAAIPTANKPISLESLLQSAGWEVKMNKAVATDGEPAPGPQAG